MADFLFLRYRYQRDSRKGLEMKPGWIIDVDGTVADLLHRLHFIRGIIRDYEQFEAGVSDDLPVEPVIEIVRALYRAGYAILFTSGRAERLRAATTGWLKHYDIPYTELYMRADDDKRPDHIVKNQILQGIEADGYEVVGVIDDRQSVVDMWREEGLTCLQCALAPSSENLYQRPGGYRPTLTLMVGPSGSGKTTWLGSEDASVNYNIHPQQIVSSDQIRMELFGQMRVDKNDIVYDVLHTLVTGRLKAGLPAVVDATNIRNKDRITVAKLAKGVCPIRYIVIDRPLSDKLATGGWRLNVNFHKTKQNLIQRHDEVFRANIKAIMDGDMLANVSIYDKRQKDPARKAAA